MTITIHTQTNGPNSILNNRAQGKGHQTEAKKARIVAINQWNKILKSITKLSQLYNWCAGCIFI